MAMRKPSKLCHDGEKQVRYELKRTFSPVDCCLQAGNGQKWLDVKAGDVLLSAESAERTVL